MRLNIGTRLFLIISLTSVAVLVANAALTRWSFERGFFGYVEELESARIDAAAEALAQVYAEDGGWQRLGGDLRRWHDLLRGADQRRPGTEPKFPPPGGALDRPPPRDGDRQGRRPPGPGDQRGRRPPPPPDPLRVAERYALTDAEGATIVGRLSQGDSQQMPIVVAGATVGTLHVARLTELEQSIDRSFAQQQQQSIYLLLALAVLIAAAISGLMAKQFTRPIRELAVGANSIAEGDYETRIDANRNDELGVLARDFNRLAKTLAKNRESRRRWISDIAHELRTPLAILQGELEALEDGVRTFDDATRGSLQAEIKRLGGLVADLHELSTSDEGRLTVEMADVDVSGLLRELIGQSSGRLVSGGIDVTQRLPSEPTTITADSARLRQLFANLIENTLRYTDSPGRLEVRCEHDDANVTIEFADSAPSVPDAALPLLFDRLYRVDTSRSRETGGSGLGLAICEAIVEAHRGRISASHSELGGVCIRIELPIAQT